MTTLRQLRALLEMTPDGPARQRAGGTVEGVARAYLPPSVWKPPALIPPHGMARTGRQVQADWDAFRLDLTDPGTAHALLTALSLAKGYDPRPAALSVSWTRRTVGDAYILCTTTGNWLFDVLEANPVAALELAVAHVLGGR